MKKFLPIYDFLRESLLDFRKEAHISVAEYCSGSGVSTRTYSKLVKHILIKPECYVRLVIGVCRVAGPEQFMVFWIKLGEWICREYGEGWGNHI